MDPLSCDNAVYEEVKVESSRSRESFDIHENKCYGNVTTIETNKCEENNHSYSKVVIMAFVIVFALLLLGTAGACVAFALQITTLKSETASLKMASSSLLEEVGHQLNISIDMLYHQQNSSYQQLNTSIRN